MRALILALLLALTPFVSKADETAIQSVITSQIEAFKVDDFDTAFTFAHPSIQQIFRTPENFGLMVRRGYPMVWRPAETAYLPLRMENGFTFQDIRITDAQGRVFVVEYQMTQTPDGWRISGVRVLEQMDFSV